MLPAGHLECGADAADRDEAKLPYRGGVARSGDVDGAEPLERGAARLPVAKREQRVHGAAGAILLDRTRVRDDRVFGGCEQIRVARDRV